MHVDPVQSSRLSERPENAEQGLVEAKERAWLSEVAALEEGILDLRVRQSEARQRLSLGINPLAAQRPHRAVISVNSGRAGDVGAVDDLNNRGLAR